MDKAKALKMLDDHKNHLLNPVEMLNWTWLRAMVYHMTDEEWESLVARTAENMR